NTLAVGGSSRVWLFDLSNSTAPRYTDWVDHGGQGISSVLVGTDGSRLVAAAQDGSTSVYDVINGDDVRLRLDSRLDVGRTSSAGLSPSGRMIATVDDKKQRATIWTVEAYGAPRKATDLPDSGREGRATAFTADGRSMLTVGASSQAAVWDLTGPAAPTLRATPTVHDGPISQAVATPDGKTLATADSRGRVRVSDITDPRRPVTIAEFTDKVPEYGTNELAISPDGTVITIGDWSSRLWDVTRGRPATRLGEFPAAPRSIAFSPDGNTVATAESGKDSVSLWALRRPGPDRKLLLVEPKVPDFGFTGPISFSPDGQTVAVGHYSDDVALWRVTPQGPPQKLGILPSSPSPGSITFSADSRTVAVAGGAATIWDVTNRSDPIRLATMPLIAQPPQSQATAAFSPNGRSLMTSGRVDDLFEGTSNGSATLWDLTSLSDLRASPSTQACAIAGGGLNAREWSRYVPEVEYRRTCPD
ncbi:MAG TPA: WD40 repeat domain-containing protein, partial [Actinoplanes sp.]|nr:WD40 repeat domain-containing protein [Actinoplanes sp.]